MADNSLGAKVGSPVVVPVIGSLTAYTPTFVGFGTVANVAVYYRRVGDQLHISGRFSAGTPTAVMATMSLPPGLTISGFGAVGAGQVGGYTRLTGTAVGKQGLIRADNTQSVITFGITDTSTTNPITSQNGNAVVATGESILFNDELVVPIAEWAGSANVAYGAGLATSAKAGLIAATTPQTALTVTGTGWTTSRAVGVAYSDSNGVWRLKFNIQGNVTSAARTSFTVSISGTTFQTAGIAQPVASISDAAASPTRSYADVTGSNLVCSHGSTTTTFYCWSGDVELASKPTWA